MKTSLRKLRAFGIHKHGDGRPRRLQQQPDSHLDELARATQDMQDMRDCYDSLLSAAAATANSAYEFSESLKEMGSCLLEKTALNEDEESGKVLLMMGKAQFELQKLVDKYRAHIFQTITSPSESLLNELRVVEEMKRLCDEKRSVYEYMMTTPREKGRSKSRKGESFSTQELQMAYDEYNDEATLFVFRLKSLKQGQSRSLLTQAARHHASQLSFFRQAVKYLEAVEPDIKFVTEQQHIDYQFKGLDDDVDDGDSEDDSDDDNGRNSEQGDGQLSFDYTTDVKGQSNFSGPRDSMELDSVEVNLPRMQVAKMNESKENSDIRSRKSFIFGEETKASSQSAPLFAEKKFDPAERVRQMRQLSSRKFHSYVLPTPVESKSPLSNKEDPKFLKTKRPNLSTSAIDFGHSSPLGEKVYENNVGKERMSSPMKLSPPPSGLKENNSNKSSSGGFPLPLGEKFIPQRQNQRTVSDAKSFKRLAFSGPLTDKSWPNKRGILGTNQANSPKLFSSPLLRTPAPPRTSPPKLSPNTSPTFASLPQISELHELPRPPLNKLPTRNSYQVGYSGPLISKRVQETSSTNRLVPKSASPLPPPPSGLNLSGPVRLSPPPVTMARSFSIPSGREKQIQSVDNMLSPPLTPIKLKGVEPMSPSRE